MDKLNERLNSIVSEVSSIRAELVDTDNSEVIFAAIGWAHSESEHVTAVAAEIYHCLSKSMPSPPTNVCIDLFFDIIREMSKGMEHVSINDAGRYYKAFKGICEHQASTSLLACDEDE